MTSPDHRQLIEATITPSERIFLDAADVIYPQRLGGIIPSFSEMGTNPRPLVERMIAAAFTANDLSGLIQLKPADRHSLFGLRRSPALLVVSDSADKILEVLKAIGRKSSDLRHILVTYCHPDHAGSLAELKKIICAGKQLSWNILLMDQIVDGKIVLHYANADWISVLIQLGVVPPPSKPPKP
jgi:hypothetical protein